MALEGESLTENDSGNGVQANEGDDYNEEEVRLSNERTAEDKASSCNKEREDEQYYTNFLLATIIQDDNIHDLTCRKDLC